MAEGLGKGEGLALLAVPIVEAFTFTQGQFKRILSTSSAWKERFAFRIHTTSGAAA